MRIDPQINAANITALGNFNPLIFRTDWFQAKEIVVGADFDNAKIDILHADVSSFRLPWGQMHTWTEIGFKYQPIESRSSGCATSLLRHFNFCLRHP